MGKGVQKLYCLHINLLDALWDSKNINFPNEQKKSPSLLVYSLTSYSTIESLCSLTNCWSTKLNILCQMIQG